jgi:hypothetical protein
LLARKGSRRLADLPRELDRESLTRSAPAEPRGPAQDDGGPLPPAPSIWRHDWLDHQLLRGWLAETAPGANAPTLVIRAVSGELPEYLADNAQATVVDSQTLVSATQARPAQRYRRALCWIDREHLCHMPDIIAAAEPLLADEAEIGFYIAGLQSPTSRKNFLHELSAQVCSDLPGYLLRFDLDARYAGGSRKRKLQRLERRVSDWMQRTNALRLWRPPLGWIARGVLTVMTRWNNARSAPPSRTCPKYCSSALLLLRRRPAAAVRAPAPQNAAPPLDAAVNA